MDNAPSYQILINHGSNGRIEALTGLLRRAGLDIDAREFEGDHLPDEVPGGETHDLIILFADVPGQANEALLRQLQSSRRDIPCLLICRATARWLPLLGLGAAALISESQLDSAAGQVQFVYQIKRELLQLSQRREARRAAGSVRELHQRLQLFVDNTTDAIATLQDGLHQSANPAWLEFFGFRALPDIYAVPFLDLVAEEDAERVRQFLRQPFNSGVQRCEFTAVRRDGTDVVAAMDSAAVSINGEQSLQLIVQAAHGNAAQNNAVREALSKDLQSGLLNEAGFFRAVNQAISIAVYQQRPSALIMLSAPQLAEIAVVLGKTDMHLLLRDIATVLRARCPPQTALGRLDGGDFVVLLPDADTESCQSMLGKLDSLQTAMQAMAPAGMSLSFQIGAAMITDEAPDADTILIRARQHQTVRRHQSIRQNGDSGAATLANTLEPLRQALKDENLLLVYQPTISLKADLREYYEVRCRVPVADRLIYPAEFLDAANQHGLGERLDRYVISHALRVLTSQNRDDLRLTINLTANSLLSQTLPVWLTQELQRQQQSSRQLILQISELDIMSAPDEARAFCQKIRDLGFALSLTHFGCSLDPIRMLGQFPADFVKLDRSLIQHVDLDVQQRAQLQDVVSSLQAQGVRVIAPMIEDIELLPLLWQANVNFVQGNCLHEPSDHMEFGLFQEEDISLALHDPHDQPDLPDQHSESL